MTYEMTRRLCQCDTQVAATQAGVTRHTTSPRHDPLVATTLGRHMRGYHVRSLSGKVLSDGETGSFLLVPPPFRFLLRPSSCTNETVLLPCPPYDRPGRLYDAVSLDTLCLELAID